MKKVKISQGTYSLDADEVIEREVKPFSKSSAHIIVPKKWIGHNVIVVFLAKTGQWLKGYRKKYEKSKEARVQK